MRTNLIRWMMVGWTAVVGCGEASLEQSMQDEPAPGEIVNESAYFAVSMPPCGSVLARWGGTEVFSNGANTGTGDSCAGSGSYGLKYQCVELVMRHFSRTWGLRWFGHAKQLLINAPKESVSVYRNGDRAHPPVPGDMLVWESSTWGHVALVVSVRADAIDIMEQNIGGSGRATLRYSSGYVGARSFGGPIAGWAHANANR